MVRKISNKELADLPEKWLNSLIDTKKYYDCALVAYEVDKDLFEKCKEDGVRCQIYKERYCAA